MYLLSLTSFFYGNLCECQYLKTSLGGNSLTCCFSLPHDSSINKDKVFPQLRGYYILNTWIRNIASNALVDATSHTIIDLVVLLLSNDTWYP